MDHLHDELDDTDLRFLERFEQLGNKDADEELDPEAVKEGLEHGQHDGPEGNYEGDLIEVEGVEGESGEGDGEGEITDSVDLDDVEGQDGDGDGQGQGDGEGDGEGQEGQGEGDQEGEGEGEGEDEQDGEGEDGEDGDSESDSEGDDDSEGENEEGGEQMPECNGDCDDSESEDDAPPCPYCTEKEKRGAEREQNKQNGTDHAIALDRNGTELFVGDEITSSGSGGNERGLGNEYVGVVMGISTEGQYKGAPLENRMLVVFRRDRANSDRTFQGGFRLPNGDKGWGVRSSLVTKMGEEGEQENQDQQDQNDEDERTEIAKDRSGEPIYYESRISSKASGTQESEDEPYEATVLGLAEDKPENHTSDGKRFIVVRRDDADKGRTGGYFAEDGQRGWGVNPELTDLLQEGMDDDELQKMLEQMGEGGGGDNKPMTKTQRERFQNICERLFKKGEQTFGETLQSKEIGPDAPGGIFVGEEISKTMEVKSRGVTYRITVSAERNDVDKDES